MSNARRVVLCALLGGSAGCLHEEPGSLIVVPAHQAHVAVATRASPPTSLEHIQVLPTKRPSRPAEIVGIVDAHVPVGDHDRAIAVLRERAAELGADAVIGVDFQHGEGHDGEPLHLSGLAIRYTDRAPPLD